MQPVRRALLLLFTASLLGVAPARAACPPADDCAPAACCCGPAAAETCCGVSADVPAGGFALAPARPDFSIAFVALKTVSISVPSGAPLWRLPDARSAVPVHRIHGRLGSRSPPAA